MQGAGEVGNTQRLDRSRHQRIGDVSIFRDPFAGPLLGDDIVPLDDDNRYVVRARHFIVARARAADDLLRAAVARGVRRCVVLGAGLDTTALRHPDGVRVLVVPPPEHDEAQRAAYPPWMQPVSEPELLEAFWALAAHAGVVITYNGRSFDWPLIASRYRLHGRRPVSSTAGGRGA